MRILLTGAAGFVGAHVAARLADDGHAVICVARPGRAERLAPLCGRVTMDDADLADVVSLERVMVRHRPEAVCHAAWQGVGGDRRNDAQQDINVTICEHLARTAASAGVSVLVGLGSQAEYGPINRIAHEDYPCNPTTRYGEAKCRGHAVMAEICARTGTRFGWMRIFSLYGPGDNPGWLIPSVIQALLRGERPALTSAEQKWDFLHVADAARAIAAVLSTPSASGPFNLGSGEAPPLWRTLEMLRDLVDPALPLGFGEVSYRPDQVMHLQADICRLRAATGWTPAISLEQGLAETVAWQRARFESGRS